MPARPAPKRRDGYKAHLAVEPETGLVTACALTAANVADGPAGVKLLATEAPGLEVLGDSGYGSGQTRAALRAAGHLQTIKPIPLQSAVPGGFTLHDFRIDRQAGMVRCPAGCTAPISSSARPASPAGASAARCVDAGPPPGGDARSACIGTRTSYAPPAAKR
jgi:Transposase DDE domain